MADNRKKQEQAQDKAKDLDSSTGAFVSSERVPVQDPPNNPPRAEKGIKGEGNPDESPALDKRAADIILSNPAEPSRADTVLKDAGQWPTEAHKATTRVAFDGGPDGIQPEQSPAPQDPQRTTTVTIEGVPEGARVRKG